MARLLNALEHPICLQEVAYLAPSHWVEHVPFAMWITSVLRPRVLVELGTFRGTSYCGFCQAVSALGLPTRAYAVDTWKGDPHNGANGPEILRDLRTHHDPRYSQFSSLLEMTFDEAAPRFQDGEIDLLHIDGYHTYEAVRHDFENYRSKLSNRGVILFHDVAEHIADFGVWKLWDELTGLYPSFTFLHEHGLGVLAVGSEIESEIEVLLSARGEDVQTIRGFFHCLGRRLRLQIDHEEAAAASEHNTRLYHEESKQRQEAEARLIQENLRATELENLLHESSLELDQQRQHIDELQRLAEFREQEIRELRHLAETIDAHQRLAEYREREIRELRHLAETIERELLELRSSTSHRLACGISALGTRLAPNGSKQRQVFKRVVRAAEMASRDGIGTLWSKAFQPMNHRHEGGQPDHQSSIGPWESDDRPVYLMIHRLEGTTFDHLGDVVSSLSSSGSRCVTVSYSGLKAIIWEERCTDGHVIWSDSTSSEPAAILEMLNRIKPAHAHFHGLLGTPEGLITSLGQLQIGYDWSVTDDDCICARNNPSDADGICRDEPVEGGEASLLADLGDLHGRALSESISEWHARFGGHLRGARSVLVPSDDTRLRLLTYYPDLNVVVRAQREKPFIKPQVALGHSCR